MKFLNAVALAALSIAGANAMRDISAKDLIKEMTVGWNLGNTLDAECTSWLDYEVDQTASETCWGNVRTTEGIFTKLLSTHFNTFRIPTTWSGHFDAEYNINPDWMKRVHEIVDYPYKNGAFVILNLHHETWNHAFADNLDAAKVIHQKLWTQIAEEFKDYDEHLIFEGMNEVRKNGTPVEWNGGDQEGWDFVNAMNKVFLETVRAADGNNPKRILMIPDYAASVSDNAMSHFDFPTDDDKLAASVHAYVPYNFALNTGEGAETTFTGTNDVDWAFSLINKYYVSKGIPTILGEYGAMNRDNEEERAKWGEYYVKSAAKLGVPTVWWDNGVFEGDGERFGIMDRSTYEIKYPKLVEALLKGVNLPFDDSFKPIPPVVPTETVEPTVVPTETVEPTVVPTETIEPTTVEPTTEPTIVPTPPASAECWSIALGYPCCSEGNTKVYEKDADGSWGAENGDWCGIIGSDDSSCWSLPLGYPCCSGCRVYLTDDDGKWGAENGNWCGVTSKCGY